MTPEKTLLNKRSFFVEVVMSQACETPLTELLRAIPSDYRASIPTQWSEGGLEIGHSLIPVGYLMRKAATKIDLLTEELENLVCEAGYLSSHEIDGGAPDNRWKDMRDALASAEKFLK